MARISVISGIFGLVLTLGLSVPAAAAGSNDGFGAFWATFSAAVGKGDQKTVAGMLKYPIFSSGEARGAAQFAAIWKDWFGAKERKCLAAAKPEPDSDPQGGTSYTAFCGEQLYMFTQEDGVWKLSDVGVND